MNNFTLCTLLSCLMGASFFNHYVDVPNDLTAAVETVSTAGIMTGTTPTTFAPEKTMTRADLAVILHRIAGTPESNSPIPFADVPDCYFKEAVSWCFAHGIINGTTPLEFKPLNGLTTQDCLVLIWRFYDAPNVNYPIQTAASDYAVTALQWASSLGLRFSDPHSLCKRGEVATWISQLLDVVTVPKHTVLPSYGIRRINDHYLFDPEIQSDTVVVLSHGLGGIPENMLSYGAALARAGFQAVSVNYTGYPSNQTIGTEVQELKTVLRELPNYFESADHIYLLGISQGGLVSELVSRQYPVDGQILLAPAFGIPDMVRSGSAPLLSTYQFLGNNLSSQYYYDAGSIEVYENLSDVPTMIFHGNMDTVIDIGYSYKYMEYRTGVELNIFENTGHSFNDTQFNIITNKAIEFIKNNMDYKEKI